MQNNENIKDKDIPELQADAVKDKQKRKSANLFFSRVNAGRTPSFHVPGCNADIGAEGK